MVHIQTNHSKLLSYEDHTIPFCIFSSYALVKFVFIWLKYPTIDKNMVIYILLSLMWWNVNVYMLFFLFFLCLLYVLVRDSYWYQFLNIDIKPPMCQSLRIYMSILKLILTRKLDKLQSKLSLLKRNKTR